MMKNIYEFKINRMDKLLGVDPKDIMFSFKTLRGSMFTLSLFENDEKKAEYKDVETICFYPDFNFEYEKTYKAVVRNEFGDEESITFETTTKTLGNFITASGLESAVFKKTFNFNGTSARLYITGLGLYSAFINGKHIGEEYLTPYMNDYDNFVRFGTYDITSLLQEENTLEVYVGKGWYKGRFGVDGGFTNIWGSELLLNAKICLENNGKKEYILTDESWQYSKSKIDDFGIYDGESRDDNIEFDYKNVKLVDSLFNLKAEMTDGVRAFESRKGTKLINPKNEVVLDFQQNASGFVKFKNFLPKGKKITLKYGEILQDGCFYNDNLRTAKATYTYTSDGQEKEIEPFFTFYGFRYVLIECDEDINEDDFTAVYISTKLENTLSFSTNNELLNQFERNVNWGRRSNFVDVPTDCPQRDERLGWTADSQVFSNTASYQVESYSFYKKYIEDLKFDQEKYFDGDFPMYSPSLKGRTGHGGAVWADAGVIIPWTIYQNFGDKKLLNKHFASMEKYVKTLIDGDLKRNDKHLLSAPFTFGDWLAQDGVCEQSMRGGTDDSFIRSAYYYYVVDILAKASKELGLIEKEREYKALCKEIKSAIQNEYFTKTGRLAINTQTGYILALKFGLYIDKQKTVDEFKVKLIHDLFQIKCGFVGAPLMIKTMLDFGMVEDAYRILFNEECPSWLYQVRMGATTVWERWNSVLPNGKISGTLMNSLNHYAYGAVADSVYSYIGGLSQKGVGWKKAKISPIPTHFVTNATIKFNSPYGEYSCDWKVNGKTFEMKVVIPNGCTADVVLPYSDKKIFKIKNGEHKFCYEMNVDICHSYSVDCYAYDILKNEKAEALFQTYLPQAYAMAKFANAEFQTSTIRSMGYLDMFGAKQEDILALDKELRKI